MKRDTLCIPCTVRAAYDIAVRATDKIELREKALGEVLEWLSRNQSNSNLTPNLLHTNAFRIVTRVTGNRDPFRTLKRESNKLALNLTPILREEFEKRESTEGFRFIVLATICGNAIDFEVEGYEVTLDNLASQLKTCLSRSSLNIDDTDKLLDLLPKIEKILYLLDNSGEIVFDKFFMEIITERYPVKIYAAVKSGPVLNDATLEDVEQVKLSEVAEIITTGSDSVGIVLEECSKEFLQKLKEVDLIIAKGQGNYESITEIEYIINKPITYILKAKCKVVAEHLKTPKDSHIVKLAKPT
ncbi:MAG: ARMT1-like domain-containing protein [Nitrososphaerota archaeon]|nr:ARMT1-like domain-containing protein [Candidatus Geocrenenecus dongiae]